VILGEIEKVPEHAGAVLILIFLLEVKHMFADFYLQTAKMLTGRCNYLHWGRAQHAAVHAVGSFVVYFAVSLMFGCPLWVMVLIPLLEWVVHYHIDYWKAWHTHCKQLDPSQGAFWRAVGFDQFLHHATYIGMAALWATGLSQ
jgi:hypothetical protein